MSVIFGIINKKGDLNPNLQLEGMFRSLEHIPHDHFFSWTNENAGLGLIHKISTEESVFEKQPYFFIDKRRVGIAKARLDNRDELLHVLEIHREQRKTICDTLLVFKAYEKWGDACVRKLAGDWSFAVFDIQQKKLFTARDHYGITALYYCETPNYFAFSGSKKMLLDLPGLSHETNSIQLAQIMIGWHGFADQTIYKKIMLLPPACFGHYENGNFIVQQYWDITETKNTRYKKDEEYVEAFREKFANAVKNRLRSVTPVGIMLSSGVDSSSVAAIASQELLTNRKELFAYTAAPLFTDQKKLMPFQVGDESMLAQEFVRGFSNIKHNIVHSEEINLPESILLSLDIFNTPIRNIGNMFWIFSIMQKAKVNGMGTMLTGQGGNTTISAPPGGYYREFIRKGYRQWIKRNIPDKLLVSILKWKRKYKIDIDGTYINKNFASEIEIMRLVKKHGYHPGLFNSSSLKKIIKDRITFSNAQGDWFYDELGVFYGIDIYDPTYDFKLLEYCYSIPPEQFIRFGSDRYMIRRAMKGVLPEEILFSRMKGIQASDLFTRMKMDLPKFSCMLEEIKNHPKCYNILNISKINSILISFENGDMSDMQTNKLLRAINVGLFLDRD